MPKSSFEKFLVERDIFGQPISVLYKGSDVYKTRVGSFCSFVVLVLTLINTYTLVVGFFNGSLQKESAQIKFYDRFDSGQLYLTDN